MAITGATQSAGAIVPPDVGSPIHVRARLISEVDHLRPGAPARIGVLLRIDPQWHVYWDGLNDSGAPVRVRLSLPEGFKAGEMIWPAPRRHLDRSGFILDHVYEGEVTLIVPVTPPLDAVEGHVAHLKASVEWVACRDACFVGQADLSLDLPVSVSPFRPTGDSTHFERALRRVPKAMEAAPIPIQTAWADGRLRITVAGASGLSFYPSARGRPPSHPIEDCQSATDHLTIRFDPQAVGAVSGVVEVRGSAHGGSGVYRMRVEAPGAVSGIGSGKPDEKAGRPKAADNAGKPGDQ